jgi:hypothetical protein
MKLNLLVVVVLFAALPVLGQQPVHLQDVIPPTDTTRPAVEHVFTCPAGYSLAHWEPGNMDYGIHFGDNIGGMFISPETYGHYKKTGVSQEHDILRDEAPVCLKDEPPKPSATVSYSGGESGELVFVDNGSSSTSVNTLTLGMPPSGTYTVLLPSEKTPPPDNSYLVCYPQSRKGKVFNCTWDPIPSLKKRKP